MNLLMLDGTTKEMSLEERQKLLIELIKKGSKQSAICNDVQDVLAKFASALAVCDKELTGTDVVKKDVDTGDHRSVKMKARPVPSESQRN